LAAGVKKNLTPAGGGVRLPKPETGKEPFTKIEAIQEGKKKKGDYKGEIRVTKNAQ